MASPAVKVYPYDRALFPSLVASIFFGPYEGPVRYPVLKAAVVMNVTQVGIPLLKKKIVPYLKMQASLAIYLPP